MTHGTPPPADHLPYWRAVAADNAWADELERCYGRWQSGNARYDARGVATPRLRELYAAKRVADEAMHAATQARRAP